MNVRRSCSNTRVSLLSTGVVQGQFSAAQCLGLGFDQFSHRKQGWMWQERDLAGLAETPPGEEQQLPQDMGLI